MRLPFRLTLNPVALAATLVVSGTAGLAAWAAHLPLGLMLGALGATATCAIAGWRPFGQPLHLPIWLRTAFVPVIGVSTGGAFTPDIAAQAGEWLVSLAALVLFIPAIHAAGFLVYRAGGLPPAEAFFGAAPGGLIETVDLANRHGADEAMVTVLQFLRLIVTIVAVPMIFLVLTGHAVGSAGGARMAGSGPLSASDVLVLAVCGVLGFWTARRLHLPAAQMIGPLLFSAAAHGLGLVHGVPPAWLVGLTQIILGAGLGVRFLGADHAMLRRASGLAILATGLSLAGAAGAALLLHALVGEDITAVFLAFAPGGLAEMSLIALSLQTSIAFVTVHHVLRIVLAVSLAKAGARGLLA